MKTTVTSRAQRIAEWLTKRGKPASAVQVHRGLDSSIDLICVRITLASLIKHGKITRATTGRGKTTYVATPIALQDGRAAHVAKPEKAQAVASHPVAARVVPKPTAQRKAAHTAFLITPNSIHHQVTNAHGGAYMAAKRLESMRIAKDMAAFEKAGGKVQRLAMHECSRPLNGDYRDPFMVASTKRGSKATQQLLRTSPSPVVDALDDDDE